MVRQPGPCSVSNNASKPFVGNCLFASLSDQLYGTSSRHPEIRANIIEHMRQLRPLFELYVHKDDVQQRRALRERTVAARRPPIDDTYEEYLSLMSRNGTYGGEPELVAFCQVYDQDVRVHLPVVEGQGGDSILYKNEHRVTKEQVMPLHICYGGDEVTRAHYDSARSRDTTFSRRQAVDRSERRRSHAGLITYSNPTQIPTPPPDILTARSQRQSRSDLTPEQFQDILQKGRRDIELGLGQLGSKERPRSSSISSSHRSSSSKRSLDDDGERSRTSKRADRRKSMKSRTNMLASSPEHDPNVSFRLRVDSPGPGTPNSTQDTEYSSDQADLNETGSNVDDEYDDGGKAAESSDTDESLDQAMAAVKAQGSQKKRAAAASRAPIATVRGVSNRTGVTAGSV